MYSSMQTGRGQVRHWPWTAHPVSGGNWGLPSWRMTFVSFFFRGQSRRSGSGGAISSLVWCFCNIWARASGVERISALSSQAGQQVLPWKFWMISSGGTSERGRQGNQPADRFQQRRVAAVPLARLGEELKGASGRVEVQGCVCSRVPGGIGGDAGPVAVNGRMFPCPRGNLHRQSLLLADPGAEGDGVHLVLYQPGQAVLPQSLVDALMLPVFVPGQAGVNRSLGVGGLSDYQLLAPDPALAELLDDARAIWFSSALFCSVRAFRSRFSRRSSMPRRTSSSNGAAGFAPGN